MSVVKEKPELIEASPQSSRCSEQLRMLKQHYDIRDGEEEIVNLLEEDHDFFAILVEAIEPLSRAFGKDRLIQMRPQDSDDGLMLRVAIQLPAAMANKAESLLNTFDEQWWLKNCRRSNGALVFDYEIQDAV